MKYGVLIKWVTQGPTNLGPLRINWCLYNLHYTTWTKEPKQYKLYRNNGINLQKNNVRVTAAQCLIGGYPVPICQADTKYFLAVFRLNISSSSRGCGPLPPLGVYKTRYKKLSDQHCNFQTSLWSTEEDEKNIYCYYRGAPAGSKRVTGSVLTFYCQLCSSWTQKTRST